MFGPVRPGGRPRLRGDTSAGGSASLGSSVGWSAEGNAPEPEVQVLGTDLRLRFVVDYIFEGPNVRKEFRALRFFACHKYRLGSTNDEGWYRRQCRFSRLAPKWGEFYEIDGDQALQDEPKDWVSVGERATDARHFLFHFRDNTFECIARSWDFVPGEDNVLRTRAGTTG